MSDAQTTPAATMPWLPLSEQEINRLATYNTEVYRDLVHTAEYAEDMRVLQARFDEWRKSETL